MRLRCEVDDIIRIVVSDELCNELNVTDISVNKDVARIILKIFEILQVSGISQCIQVDDSNIRLAVKHVVDKRGADETCAASH